MRVCVTFGTRPEAIKLAPVIKVLRKQKIKTHIVITSQHTTLLQQVLSVFRIKPHIDFKIMRKNQTLDYVTSAVVKKAYTTFKELKPDVVVVQGDTTTAFACALSAYYLHIPVAHVEAGLRTHDRFNPFPEEINRRLIAPLADYNFAPTKRAEDNLMKEGISKSTIFRTGNTVVDALLYLKEKVKRPSSPQLKNVDFSKRVILLTTHRRESFGQDIRNILKAVKKIMQEFQDVEVIFPVHPNPNVVKPARELLSDTPRVHLIDPIPYTDLIYIMNHCTLILTDSGGIQEEAPAFRKPVLVLRKKTERPEGVEAGVARLVGTDTDKIAEEASKLLTSPEEYACMQKGINPYGDGKASERIAEVLLTGKLKEPFPY